MEKIAIINGPNLNLLGIREPEIYGHTPFDKYFESLKMLYKNKAEIIYIQNNVEGELINALHQNGFNTDGIILNAGGYAHNSIALADAVKAISTPVISLHISNTFAREKERHQDLIAAQTIGSIVGFGLEGYKMALDYFLH